MKFNLYESRYKMSFYYMTFVYAYSRDEVSENLHLKYAMFSLKRLHVRSYTMQRWLLVYLYAKQGKFT